MKADDVQLQPVCPGQAKCKCCGSIAALYGVIDFHSNCEAYRGKVLTVSGVPVYYYRCPACQFLFTTAFDHFTHDDFRRYIYNDEYLQVDPDYRESRPLGNAGMVAKIFAAARPRRMLDYGGGNGACAAALRARGFAPVDSYDPFVPGHDARPAGPYDCILCFEVVEHATDPARTFADMAGLLAEPGLILFSTLVQPANFDQQGMSWWYIGPRNGHVSLYSRASLRKLAEPLGFQMASFNDNMHVLFRALPDFAKHLAGNRR